MRLNPVLRNESRLTVRTPRFTIMLLIYIAILSAGTLLFYNIYSNEIYASGLNMQGSIILYIGMAFAQAVLLMFIVPSLTATSICSEREKQTLDILLSTRLSPFQIIIGKLLASSLKVIMLIVCTIPLYAVCALIGGVKISNILVLILSFIINTIFVGAIGVFVSTYVKTSKVATALTYAIVLFIFVGTIVIAYVIWMITMLRLSGGPITTPPTISPIIYLSPAVGFGSILSNQVGLGNDFLYMLTEIGISKYAEYISIGIQGILTFIFLYLAARRLNPLNRKRNKKVKIKTKKKVKE
ncbi:ABC transporter permease subunit [Clostridium tertium]|jgi:ABC-2 type transport system permease protein|uniref:ABC transporter permease n=1 Tax=Clostridium TaxID=1485 RepID=UPI000BE41FE3|nr:MULTISPECIES: ABC transporter permease subunit [Clostridium]MBS5307888.1 ABC transporter permease subunit [Clostridium sp.]MBU6136063.1 ABC transporter permease [Clostridium tertium]MDB1921288.1 ABC transporter permease subunit [Clostridium tertium]MDB1924533.1 ABC transporter permease subunit [Clostridium tertium]MDB1928063.1 ABC transporter permease subunit [Clostridium tertium]